MRRRQVGQVGERLEHLIWDTRESPQRTKLRAEINRKLGATHGQHLNFFKEGGNFIVQVSNKRDPQADWSVQVDLETRARLTHAHLRLLGAQMWDTLVFTLLGRGRASIEVLKAGTAGNSPPEPFSLPEELEEGQTYVEGAAKQVTLNAYERDARAREACLRHYGTNCSVCGFNFEQQYGEIGEGYIHVHHLTPLSQVRREYRPDPVNDLRPVCPNCHAMLHRRKNPPYSIEELKSIIEARRRAVGARPRAAGRHTPPN
jgi:predicted HNH restriction endonuclease